MTIPQQKFRELVFQYLYSQDISQTESDELIDLLMDRLSVPRSAVKDARERVSKILKEQKEIDSKIRETSESYEFNRIPGVERNILRLGIFELFYDDEIPPKVAISEAIRLARKFASRESSSFVNALLDQIFKKQMGEHIDKKEIQDTVQALEELERVSEEAAQEQMKPDLTDQI